jgi:hypothetical protein
MNISCKVENQLGHHVSWEISIKVKIEFDIPSIWVEGILLRIERLTRIMSIYLEGSSRVSLKDSHVSH